MVLEKLVSLNLLNRQLTHKGKGTMKRCTIIEYDDETIVEFYNQETKKESNILSVTGMKPLKLYPNYQKIN